jgi:hypothetical protein
MKPEGEAPDSTDPPPWFYIAACVVGLGLGSVLIVELAAGLDRAQLALAGAAVLLQVSLALADFLRKGKASSRWLWLGTVGCLMWLPFSAVREPHHATQEWTLWALWVLVQAVGLAWRPAKVRTRA